MAKETVKTPMQGYGHADCQPSGKVVTDGKVASVDLPTRSVSKDSVPQVFYDQNAQLPARTGKK